MSINRLKSGDVNSTGTLVSMVKVFSLLGPVIPREVETFATYLRAWQDRNKINIIARIPGPNRSWLIWPFRSQALARFPGGMEDLENSASPAIRELVTSAHLAMLLTNIGELFRNGLRGVLLQPYMAFCGT